MTRRLAFLLAAGLLCGAAPIGAQVIVVGGGGSTTADPLSLANIAGTTSVCSVGVPGTANSVCIVSGGIDGEGSSADAFEATLVFGDSTADATATLIGTSGGALLRVGDGTLAAPSLAFGAATGTGLNRNVLSAGELGFGVTGTRALTLFTTGVHVPNGLQLWIGNSTTDSSQGLVYGGAAGKIKVSDGSTGGGDLIIGTGILTASTMTASTTAETKTVTSSYLWTNAMVAALAGTAGDINVATLPAKTNVERARIIITGAAVGPTTVTVSCGDATVGTPFVNYVLPGDAKAAANTVYGDAIDGSETGASLFDATAKWIPAFLPSYTATTLVTCHFISTGANLSTVTGSTGRVILKTSLDP